MEVGQLPALGFAGEFSSQSPMHNIACAFQPAEPLSPARLFPQARVRVSAKFILAENQA